MRPTFMRISVDPKITTPRDFVRDTTETEARVRTDLDAEWEGVRPNTDSQKAKKKCDPQLVKLLGKCERVATTSPIGSRLTAAVDKCGVDIQRFASVIQPAPLLNWANIEPDFHCYCLWPGLMVPLPTGMERPGRRHWSLWTTNSQRREIMRGQFKLYDRRHSTSTREQHSISGIVAQCHTHPPLFKWA